MAFCLVGFNDKHLHHLPSIGYKMENQGRQRVVTLTWSDCNGYQRATADPDSVSAWMWVEPDGKHGWVVFYGDRPLGAGHVGTAEEAQHAAELCVAARIAAGLLK